MLPVLFSPDATSWENFGLGVLVDAISCEAEENRNGSYELELTYPITGAHFADIALRCLILAKPNYTDDPQPFRIYNISKPLNGIVTINAQHISYDLSGYVDAPFEAIGSQEALQKMQSASIIYPAACPFTLSTTIFSTQAMRVKRPTSIRALMGGLQGSLLDTYGGEWRFDKYSCTLQPSRGENRGVIIRYGKNMTDLRQEENNASVYTGVYPYYFSEETGVLVTLPEKVVNASGTFGFTRIYPLDLTEEFVSAPDAAALRTRAERYITENSIGVPKVNLTVSFVEADSMKDRVDLCDTVSVRFDKLGVSATAKCIRTKWDVLKERYIEAELGSAHNSLAATIAKTSEITAAIKEQASSQFQSIAAEVAEKVTGNTGGNIVLHDTDNDGKPNEILIMNSDSILTATKIIRINNGGIAFSKTGYHGTYTTAWNIDGEFVADFIAAGTLATDHVKILGDTQFYWDNNNITIINPSNTNQIIRFGKYNGTNYGLGFSTDGGATWQSGFDFNGIRMLGGASGSGRATMDGDAFSLFTAAGVSLGHIGTASCMDENGNIIQAPYYRLGTWWATGGSEAENHGAYSFSGGRYCLPKGAFCVCIGYQNMASGVASVALGRKNNATGNQSIAAGDECEATAPTSIAIGYKSKATQPSAIAIGSNCTSSYNWALSMGCDCSASAIGAIAMGDDSEATGMDAVAIGGINKATSHGAAALGHLCKATKPFSVAIGISAKASHDFAFVTGSDTKSSRDCQFVCGRLNADNANAIFILGNGTRTGSSTFTYSNAMTVDYAGNMWIAGTLTQSSDKRLKTVSGDIPDVSGIRAVRFRWNEKKYNGDKDEHIGYFAQDVEEKAPYLVHKNPNGYKTLDYIELLCAKVECLEQTVQKMAKRIEELESKLEVL